MFLHGYHSSRGNQKNNVSFKESNSNLKKKNTDEKESKDLHQKPKMRIVKNENMFTDFIEKNNLTKTPTYNSFQSNTKHIQNKNGTSFDTKTLESDVKESSENVERKVNVVALTGFIVTVFTIIGGFLITALFIDTFGLFFLMIGVPILAIVGLIFGIIGTNQIRRNPKTQKGLVFGLLSIIGNSIILVFAFLFWLGTLLL